jgi:hypothetical protein
MYATEHTVSLLRFCHHCAPVLKFVNIETVVGGERRWHALTCTFAADCGCVECVMFLYCLMLVVHSAPGPLPHAPLYLHPQLCDDC